MQSLRHERVRELLKRQIGEVLRREVPVGEVGMVTVNDVGISGDLHSATVFVGVLGPPAQKQRTMDYLAKERKRIQGLVAHAIVLKYTPQLRFVLDDSIERGNRVLAILDELDHSAPASPEDPGPAA